MEFLILILSLLIVVINLINIIIKIKKGYYFSCYQCQRKIRKRFNKIRKQMNKK